MYVIVIAGCSAMLAGSLGFLTSCLRLRPAIRFILAAYVIAHECGLDPRTLRLIVV